jgi:hypothetical protein
MAWKEWDYLEVLTSADLNGNFAECVRLDEVQTLTNKTLTTPTITNKSATGTDSGVETLVNKTLTSPIIAAMGSTFTIPAAAATPIANKMANESIIKAWGLILAAPSISAGYNVLSVSKPLTGVFEVVFKTIFSAGYSLVITPEHIFEVNCNIYSKATGSFVVNFFDSSNDPIDPVYFNFIAIGAQ